MKTEEEKLLTEGFRKLSSRSRYFALAQVLSAVEMEENARKIANGKLLAKEPKHQTLAKEGTHG